MIKYSNDGMTIDMEIQMELLQEKWQSKSQGVGEWVISYFSKCITFCNCLWLSNHHCCVYAKAEFPRRSHWYRFIYKSICGLLPIYLVSIIFVKKWKYLATWCPWWSGGRIPCFLCSSTGLNLCHDQALIKWEGWIRKGIQCKSCANQAIWNFKEFQRKLFNFLFLVLGPSWI